MNTHIFSKGKRGLLPALLWNALFLAKPLIFSALMVGLWHYLRSKGICLRKESETQVTTGTLVVLGIIYTIVAGKAVDSAMEDIKQMSDAIKEHDRHAYLINRDERIPMPIHLFLGAMTTLMLLTVMAIKYDETCCGIFSVGTVAYTTCFLYFVVQKLDNPLRSPWFIANTPPEWNLVDMDKYRTRLCEMKKTEEDKIYKPGS